jgi:hypothetical protein
MARGTLAALPLVCATALVGCNGSGTSSPELDCSSTGTFRATVQRLVDEAGDPSAGVAGCDEGTFDRGAAWVVKSGALTCNELRERVVGQAAAAQDGSTGAIRVQLSCVQEGPASACPESAPTTPPSGSAQRNGRGAVVEPACKPEFLWVSSAPFPYDPAESPDLPVLDVRPS